MDLLGGSKSMQAGRLLAVLWLFCASFAVQAIAVGQSVTGRNGPGAQTGDIAARDMGSADRPVARQVFRAVALPDFRFTGARAEGKASPGGEPDPALPLAFSVLPAVVGNHPAPVAQTLAVVKASRQGECIRGPPAAENVL